MNRPSFLRDIAGWLPRERALAVLLGVMWMVPWLVMLHAGRAWWLPPLTALGVAALVPGRRATRDGSVVATAAMGAGWLLAGLSHLE